MSDYKFEDLKLGQLFKLVETPTGSMPRLTIGLVRRLDFNDRSVQIVWMGASGNANWCKAAEFEAWKIEPLAGFEPKPSGTNDKNDKS